MVQNLRLASRRMKTRSIDPAVHGHLLRIGKDKAKGDGWLRFSHDVPKILPLKITVLWESFTFYPNIHI